MELPQPSSSTSLNTEKNLLITIRESKLELKEIIENLNKLKVYQMKLEKLINNSTTNEDEWETNFKDIENTKLIINELIQKYSNPKNLKLLKIKLNKRQSKRKRLKNKNEILKKLKLLRMKSRDKLHENINKWIENEKDKELRILKHIEETKQTEKILFGVTKKINEAKEYIQLLNSLKELRRLRKIALAEESQKPDLNEKSFENKINQLIIVWKDALNEYENEEKQLRSLITNKTKTVEDQWIECLFGNYQDNEGIQPKSEKNLDDFLLIRKTWDSYLVPENSNIGSSIPIGWVMPNENPSDEWGEYINCSSQANEN